MTGSVCLPTSTALATDSTPCACYATHSLIELPPVFQISRPAAALPLLTSHAAATPQVPAKLQNWPLSQFQARMRPPSPRRPRPANLFYEREFYYWSGQPPASLGDQPDRPPLSCFVQPSGVHP